MINIEHIRNIRRTLRKAQKYKTAAEFAEAIKELGNYVPSIGDALVSAWNDATLTTEDPEADDIDLSDAINQAIADETRDAVNEAMVEMRERLVKTARGSAYILTDAVLTQFDACPAASLTVQQVQQDIRDFLSK